MISNTLKYIIFIIILGITIYYYINRRNIGCRDKNALNYNSEVNIHDVTKCIYKVKGCMDKNAPNYNIYANTSCKEDCTGCDLKGNCKLCEYQEECTNSCPECICKKKVYGCTRDWAINYDKNATVETNCISSNDIMKKISVVSGGDCAQCSGKVSIRIGDQYPVIGGNYGINVLVLERHPDLPIKFNKSFSTGNYDIENKKFVEFMKKYVFNNDIVIITVRGDATGRKRTDSFVSAGANTAFIGEQLSEEIYTNLQLAEAACSEKEEECIGINKTEKSEYILMSYKSKLGFRNGFTALTRDKLFLDRILTDETKTMLANLGAKNPEIIREGSYVLIGSFLNDIYYETYSANADSYFPYFDLQSYGCINVNHPHFEKIRLNPSKNKLLSNIGDTQELDVTRVDTIYRCAQEALREGYFVFSVSKTNCYVYKIKDEFKDQTDIKDFFKYKKFIKYNNDLNQTFRIGTGECRTNYNLVPYGNNYDESLFYIKDVSYSGLFSMFYENMMVQTYSSRAFNGIRRDLGVGNHQAISIVSLSPRAIDGKLYMQVTSLKVPPKMKVTLFRNVYKDEDMKTLSTYDMSIEEQKNNYFNLNLSNTEGVKITCMNSKGLILRDIGYRTWNNVIKNLKIQAKEVFVKVYLYNLPVKQKESELKQPCVRYGVMVPGWYQDTRFGQRNQCTAPKGKLCCNTTYSQGSKKGEIVRLDGVITLRGKIIFNNSVNIFYPETPNDKLWLEFKSNYPVTGQILASSSQASKIVDYEFNDSSLTIMNDESNYSGMNLTTLGREACSVDFENVRSSQEVKDWMGNCADNLDEITSVKWKDYGMNNAFSGDQLENTPNYYTLFDAQIGCLQNKDTCGGINKNVDNNFMLMNKDSKIVTIKGFNGYEKVQNLINSPETREGFDLEDIFEIRYFKEISRLKNTSYDNRVGYLEFYDKNNNKVRDIEFGIWPYFWNNIAYSGNETKFKVSTVDPDAVILKKSVALEGPTDNAVKDSNILFQEYPNVPKDQNFTSDVSFLIVNKIDFGVTFFDEPSLDGLSFTLTYGRYNLPDSLSFIVQSMRVNISFCVVRLFMEYNFEEELIRFEHKVEASDMSYDNINNLIDENVRIKSIIIERVSFDNLVSNNSDYDNFDENKQYDTLSYPITFSFKNEPFSYLDVVYDIFRDGLKLYDNEKKVFLIKETDIAGYVSGMEILKGTYINSGGGYGYMSNTIKKLDRKDVLDFLNNNYGCIYTLKQDDNTSRKIIFFGGKLLVVKNENGQGVFYEESLSDISFSKIERSVNIRTTDSIEVKNQVNLIFNNANETTKNKLIQLYNLLIKVDFEKSLVEFRLASIYEDLLNIPFIMENNGALLNTKFNIQIEDDLGYSTRYLKFYGQKFVIDYNINSKNKVNTNDIKVSKKEKSVQVNHRTKYSINDEFQINYDTKFNYRKDFYTTVSQTISDRLNGLMQDIMSNKGYFETKNRSDRTINRYEFEKGKVKKFNKFVDQNEILFRPEEMILTHSNQFNKNQTILPIKDNMTIGTINGILNYYLYNEKCYVKLFNRNTDIVRLVLCKEGKFLLKDENDKEITISGFSENPKVINDKYSYLFDLDKWNDAQRNFDIDLDQSKISIQIDNGTDILMIDVDPSNMISSYNELDSFFSISKSIRMSSNIQNTIYSNLIFKDANEKITKQIGFTGDIMLFNMPIKYLELNNQSTTYVLKRKDTDVLKISLPKGMNGVYTYGTEENKVLVDRVERTSSDEAVLFDIDNNIIQRTKDISLHEYIFNVVIEGYNRPYKIEYYPKINQWKIRLYQQDENISVIEMYDTKTRELQNIKDVFGNIIKTVNGNSCYIIENNYTNIKVIKKDRSFKYHFSMGKF